MPPETGRSSIRRKSIVLEGLMKNRPQKESLIMQGVVKAEHTEKEPQRFLVVGVQCWIPDPEQAYLRGKTIEDKHKGIWSVLPNGQSEAKDVNATDLLPVNPPLLDGVADLTELSYLHDAAVLENLRFRFQWDLIYTFTGTLVVALNPYFKIPYVYTQRMLRMYTGEEKKERPLAPHAYLVVQRSYQNMITKGSNQSIVVSGESGAGKTETTKILMQYLAIVGLLKEGQTTDVTLDGGVQDMMLKSNPILESFGNAKTIRNDNSSRFGKFMEIHFDKKGTVCGAAIRNYLLEKSRVVHLCTGERNYHIFYELCCGASAEEKKEFNLLPVDGYKYLSGGGCTVVDNFDDADVFRETREAMGILGLNEHLQRAIWSIISGCLWLGNLEYTDISGGKAASTQGQAGIVNDDPMIKAAALFGIETGDLKTQLTQKRLGGKGMEEVMVPLGTIEAVDTRDALAKAVYGTLFNWLVEQINVAIVGDYMLKTSTIGVLDIFGFEIFGHNGFEQLCINYANEKLQQNFNQQVFKLEQEEYNREAIVWSFVDFSDNSDCVDMIERTRPAGLLSTLNEECIVPKGTDATFVDKIRSNLKSERHLVFPRPTRGQSGEAFTVKHYSDDVTYDASGFLEKNRDTVREDVTNMLAASKLSLLASLFSPKDQEMDDLGNWKGPQKKRAAPTVVNSFRQQLGDLVAMLQASTQQFIRCIKPNSVKKDHFFDANMVLAQLRSNGVIDAVRIAQCGYPNRLLYPDFNQRYKIAVSAIERAALSTVDQKEFCLKLLVKMKIRQDKYQPGKSKIFFRAGELAIVEDTRSKILYRHCVNIQKEGRRYNAQKIFARMKALSVVIQCCLRQRFARKRMRVRARAAKLLQEKAKQWIHRLKIIKAWKHKCAARRIQGACRKILLRTMHSKKIGSIKVIQGRCRRIAALSYFKHIKDCSSRIKSGCQRRLTQNKVIPELVQKFKDEAEEWERIKAQREAEKEQRRLAEEKRLREEAEAKAAEEKRIREEEERKKREEEERIRKEQREEEERIRKETEERIRKETQERLRKEEEEKMRKQIEEEERRKKEEEAAMPPSLADDDDGNGNKNGQPRWLRPRWRPVPHANVTTSSNAVVDETGNSNIGLRQELSPLFVMFEIKPTKKLLDDGGSVQVTVPNAPIFIHGSNGALAAPGIVVPRAALRIQRDKDIVDFGKSGLVTIVRGMKVISFEEVEEAAVAQAEEHVNEEDKSFLKFLGSVVMEGAGDLLNNANGNANGNADGVEKVGDPLDEFIKVMRVVMDWGEDDQEGEGDKKKQQEEIENNNNKSDEEKAIEEETAADNEVLAECVVLQRIAIVFRAAAWEPHDLQKAQRLRATAEYSAPLNLNTPNVKKVVEELRDTKDHFAKMWLRVAAIAFNASLRLLEQQIVGCEQVGVSGFKVVLPHGISKTMAAALTGLAMTLTDMLAPSDIIEEYWMRCAAVWHSCDSVDMKKKGIEDTMFNAGVSMALLGEIQKSDQYFQRCLELQQQRLGADHHHTAETLCALAANAMQKEEFDAAQEKLIEAVRLREEYYGVSNEWTLATRKNLVEAYARAGKGKEALTTYKLWLAAKSSLPTTEDERAQDNAKLAELEKAVASQEGCIVM